MSKKDVPSNSAAEGVASGGPAKRKPGRPRTSPHDLATQKKLNLQRYREAKREENEVRVDIYLPRAWHDWVVNLPGVNLRAAALEAFTLWLEKKGFPAHTPGEPPPAAKA